jgi:hypothetical protein
MVMPAPARDLEPIPRSNRTVRNGRLSSARIDYGSKKGGAIRCGFVGLAAATALEDTLEYHVEGKPPGTYKAGEVLMIPAGAIHWAKNVGSGNGAELATYVVEKGKPLITRVK